MQHNQLACVKDTRRNSHCKCSFQTLAWGEKASWKLGAGLCCPEQGRRWPGPFNGEAQRFLEPRRANVSWDFSWGFQARCGSIWEPTPEGKAAALLIHPARVRLRPHGGEAWRALPGRAPVRDPDALGDAERWKMPRKGGGGGHGSPRKPQ